MALKEKYMKNWKHMISLVLASVVLISCGTNKNISYVYRPLAEEGCYVTISVINQNEQLLLVTSVQSDRLTFGDNPTMLLKNFNGDVLKLEGVSL